MLCEGTADGGRVEVLEETLDLPPGDMDDEANRRGDWITGLQLSMEYVALNEPTFEELPCERLIPKLGDSPGEILQERQIRFARLRSTRDVVPDLCFRRIEFADRIQVAPLDRSEKIRRNRVGLVGHGCNPIRSAVKRMAANLRQRAILSRRVSAWSPPIR